MMWMLGLTGLMSCQGEPERSYCESVCDWAVTCQGTEREVDADALSAQCLAETAASDASCAKAEAGTIDPASRKLLQTCTTAVDAASGGGQCEGFVGSIDEIKAAAPPTECASQGADAIGTLDAAVYSTAETGEQLCQRFTDTFCHRTEECIIGDFAGDVPQEAIDALGGTPYELCLQRLDPQFTGQCKSDDFYAAEASRTTEPNAPRQFARECLRDFSTISCADLFAGDLSETCAGAFTTPDQALAVATAMYGLSEDFAAYAP
ncbi:MAG: hypothetical protein KC621_15395 [Myxococcales bacterium]|nr:hypothetical protein [Myxococcales bacterium]